SLIAIAMDDLGQSGASVPRVIKIHSHDVVPPTITITSAPPNFVSVINMVTLAGTARDNHRLDRVEYQVTSGPFLGRDGKFLPAQGTSNWLANVTLAPGQNMVRVRSVDFANNLSAPA